MTRAIPAPVHGPTSRNSAAATPRQTAPGLVYVALLVAVVVLFSLIRIRLLNMPLERDEGEYAYGGQLLLHGLAPYQHLYSVKLPGVYASYALIVAAFGQSPAGIRLGLLLVNVVSILLLFHITRRLLCDLSALVAAASYALLSAGADVNGVAAHATHFVVVFALAAILVLLKALDSGKRALIFVAGLLFGTAFLMKQPGLVFAAWAAI